MYVCEYTTGDHLQRSMYMYVYMWTHSWWPPTKRRWKVCWPLPIGNVHVCMYMFVCMYVYVCVCVLARWAASFLAHLFKGVIVRGIIYIYIYIYIYTHTNTFVFVHTHTCICIHICMHIYRSGELHLSGGIAQLFKGTTVGGHVTDISRRQLMEQFDGTCYNNLEVIYMYVYIYVYIYIYYVCIYTYIHELYTYRWVLGTLPSFTSRLRLSYGVYMYIHTYIHEL